MGLLGVWAFAAAAPVTWRLDPAGSDLYVQIDRDPHTLASRFAHNHVVVARDWRGSVTWDPVDPGACRAEVEVPVARLEPDAPEWRARLGVGKAISEKRRAQIRRSMLDEDQLFAAAHPTLSFTASSCRDDRVRGHLSIRGVTREIEAPLVVRVDGVGLHVAGTFSIRATEFGFEPYSALGGAVKNQDVMRITFALEGVQEPVVEVNP